jgi:hypothetical protein
MATERTFSSCGGSPVEAFCIVLPYLGLINFYPTCLGSRLRTTETSLVLILWTKLEQINERTTDRQPLESQPSHAGPTNGKSAPEEVAIRRSTTVEITFP